MDEKDKQIAELQAQLATATASTATAKAEFTAYKAEKDAEFTALQAKVEKMEADKKAEAVSASRTKFSKMLEDAVADKRITPAQRESFTKVLRINDDEAVVGLDEDDVLSLIGEPKSEDFSRDQSRQQGDQGTGDPSTDLTDATYKYMQESGTKDFSAALNVVMRGNPDLSREYMLSNGEVKH